MDNHGYMNRFFWWRFKGTVVSYKFHDKSRSNNQKTHGPLDALNPSGFMISVGTTENNSPNIPRTNPWQFQLFLWIL